MANQAKAQEFWQQARAHLMKLASAGNPRSMSPGIPRRGASGTGPTLEERLGGFQIRYGQTPTDSDVDAFIRSLGGNPYVDGRTADGKSTGAVAKRQAGESVRDLFNRLSTEYQAKVDEANAANEARYQEVKGSNQALYGRVMGDVDNWGEVQRQLNEERAAENFGDIQASLAGRGLGNTTIGDSFRARNARDLALTQQDLSERKSARRIGYDVDLTNNANNFIERRTDRAPDMAPLMQLAAKLGEAEAYRAGRGSVAGLKPRYRVPNVGGASPFAAMQLQQYANATNPAALAYGMFANLPRGGGYTYTPRESYQVPVDPQAEYDRISGVAFRNRLRQSQM